MKTYDMSKYQRIIGVDEGRITGTFYAIGLEPDRDVWVKPVDVVIWDEGHHSGRVLYSGDLSASVRDGVAKLSKHMVKTSLLPDVEEVWDEMLQVLVSVVETYWASAPAVPTSSDSETGEQR